MASLSLSMIHQVTIVAIVIWVLQGDFIWRMSALHEVGYCVS